MRKLDKTKMRVCVSIVFIIIIMAIILGFMIKFVLSDDEKVVNFKFSNIIGKEQKLILQGVYVVSNQGEIMEIVPDTIPEEYTCVSTSGEDVIRIIYSGEESICIDIYQTKGEYTKLMFSDALFSGNERSKDYPVHIKSSVDDNIYSISLLKDSWILELRFIEHYDFSDELHETMNFQTMPHKSDDFKQILDILNVDGILGMEEK